MATETSHDFKPSDLHLDQLNFEIRDYSDKVINAYITGGLHEQQRLIEAQRKLFDDRIGVAVRSSTIINTKLIEMGIQKDSVYYMRINDHQNFEFLFVINEHDMCKKDFLNIYQEVSNIRKKHRSDFYLNFHFAPKYEDSFDYDSVLADGYATRIHQKT